jgi:hypothetical protein
VEFGLDKRTKTAFKRGKLTHFQNLVIDINRKIQEKLEQGKTHKKGEGIQHQQMKERLKLEYNGRLRMIMKSELNARNKITAIGALAVPVLRYSFSRINWRIEDIKRLTEKPERY